jgi:hypothetical protein
LHFGFGQLNPLWLRQSFNLNCFLLCPTSTALTTRSALYVTVGGRLPGHSFGFQSRCLEAHFQVARHPVEEGVWLACIAVLIKWR